MHPEFARRISSGRLPWFSPVITRSIIFCEANAIYGIIIAVILINKMTLGGYVNGHLKPDFNYAMWYYAGYAIFSAGLSVGISNVVSG